MEVNGYEIEPGANLTGADIYDTNLHKVDLEDGLEPVPATLTGATMPDGTIHD